MDSRHGKEGEVSEGNPSTSALSFKPMAAIDMEGEFKVGKGLFKKAKRAVTFHRDTHFTFNLLP